MFVLIYTKHENFVLRVLNSTVESTVHSVQYRLV